MRSSRLPSDLSPNTTAKALDDLRRRGQPVLDLTETNPTRVGLAYPADLLTPLGSASGLVYDPHPLGAWCAREAVSADFARRGLTVPPQHIALTASTSEAYALLFKLFCDAGDSVMVPYPSYPLFEHLTVLESVVARPYRLEYHGGWRIDLEHFQSSIVDDTRAVLVVSPNNPTGSFLHRDDLTTIADVCATRDIVLIGDEVFADFPLDDSPHATSVLAASNLVTCSLGGLSKSAGLPQLKLGWIGLSGPADRLGEAMSAYEVVADTYLSVSTPVQIALPTLLRQGAGIRAQIQSRITRNLKALRQAAASVPEVSVLTTEGGWSAVVKVPAYRSEETLVLELLVEDCVLTHPGYFFDFETEAFLVVSLLVEPDLFDRGTERMLARACVSS